MDMLFFLLVDFGIWGLGVGGGVWIGFLFPFTTSRFITHCATWL